ncbi:hypothetical protein GZH47_29245 [Paenibacillus rhizovicinus]|uniref:PhiEco32-like amidoligase-type 2 protein n=1 Tax=Paenibacillus rhizovicinus TaxID=2704463 RepID=A0A6C0P7F7_9BACL|nr:hypothetical protein [Paenibacillus rhizovicinus]QHW34478.1 hypothetical protein GZH47_29245 [Paenibacillus rhizovicinus]
MAGTVWLWDGKACRLCAGRPDAGAESAGPAEGDAVIVAGEAAAWPGSRGARGFGALCLNADAAEFAAWDRNETERRLRRAGAAVLAPGQQALRSYEVSLFQLQPLAVEKLQLKPRAHAQPQPKGRALRANVGSNGEPVMKRVQTMSDRDARYRPFARLAVRALYACGLDNGIVELADDGDGKCYVAGIRLPSAAAYRTGIWREAADALAARLQADARDRNSGEAPAILLGADPEFLLLAENGRVVSAARYLEGGHGAGCDAIVVGGAVVHPIAELRPAPSPTPDGLARNIRRLLQEAARRIPDQPPLRWAAGGMPAVGFALGGHVHLSGVPLTGRLLRQLDSYVAFPLAMIESPSERIRRPRYGALGDFRLQPHGGFEYRTLPSWLASPLAAKAAFALALLCARESGSLSYLPSSEDEYLAAYYEGDRPTLTRCLEGLAASMANTASYPELSRWIEPLLQAIRDGRTWDAAGDFRAKWRISPRQA